MAKSKEKLKAIELRGKGESIKVIAKILKVSVSSVSEWCRDVILSKKQIEELERRGKDPHYGRRLSYVLGLKKEKNRKIKRLLKCGIDEIGSPSKRELFLVGSALYWAEGFKKDSQAGFANSDPAMIRIFLRWLFECFNYGFEDLIPRITVNISHKHRIDKIQQHWSKVTNIPLENFKKPFYQKFKWKKIYENPNDYYGILRVKVRKSTDFLRRVHGYIEGLRLQAQ